MVQSGADVLTGDPLDTDLQHFHPQSESFDELPKGGLAVVKRIAPGIHGDVFRCLWAQGEQGEQGEMHVAVKKLHAQAPIVYFGSAAFGGPALWTLYL